MRLTFLLSSFLRVGLILCVLGRVSFHGGAFQQKRHFKKYHGKKEVDYTFHLLGLCGWLKFGFIFRVLRWISIHGHTCNLILVLTDQRVGIKQWYPRLVFCVPEVFSDPDWSSSFSVESVSKTVPRFIFFISVLSSGTSSSAKSTVEFLLVAIPGNAVKNECNLVWKEKNGVYVWSWKILLLAEARLDPRCSP